MLCIFSVCYYGPTYVSPNKDKKIKRYPKSVDSRDNVLGSNAEPVALEIWFACDSVMQLHLRRAK